MVSWDAVACLSYSLAIRHLKYVPISLAETRRGLFWGGGASGMGFLGDKLHQGSTKYYSYRYVDAMKLTRGMLK